MKRFLCCLLAVLALLLCTACWEGNQNKENETAQSAQTTTGSAQPVSDPVSVKENHANRDTVDSVRPAPSADASQTTPTPAPDTPPTGDTPLAPLIGACGLILLCAAGLLMLKRF